jgi:hypothetical protein
LPWTESRSREEWLAEVRRRGERMRRRRQFSIAIAGAFALVLPMSAVAGYLAGQPDRTMELSVAGQATAGGVTTDPDDRAISQLAPAVALPTTTTTIAEVHNRLATVGGGSVAPTVPPVDDPVVRLTPTTLPLATGSGGGGGGTAASPLLAANAPQASSEPAPPCAASEFRLTVTMDKDAFAAGERVRGSSVLEKRSPGTCAMPNWWIEIAFLDGAGKDMSELVQESGSSQSFDQDRKMTDSCREGGDCRRVVETGPVYTHTFYWGTLDCSAPYAGPVVPVAPDGSNCVPFPAGGYSVVATWTGPGAGPPTRSTFKIGL